VEARVELDVLQAFQSSPKQLAVSVKLDALFYASGQQAHVTVDFGGAAPNPLPDVVIVSSESRDVEKLTLTPAAGASTSRAPCP